jgi:formate-dependent nitrite reductase membrane component NrfD
MVPEMAPTSYYGRSVLKAPVWKGEVAIYLYTGGLAGGSAMLAATARAQGNDVLARRALYSALAGAAVSPALLIKDLGVPRRFSNMLRVLKVTSPMNVGTWILSGTGTALGVAVACETLGILPGVRRLAETSAALLGPALSTYTAVLLSDTAVPAWHEAHLEMPFLFAGSAAATAGAAATLLTPPEHAGLARSLATGGVLAELAAAEVMERRLGELAEPYRTGEPGRLSRAATALGLAGAAALALGGRRRRTLAAVGAAAVLAASLCERWAILKAGTLSANDPSHTVGPQRRRLSTPPASAAR